MRFRVRDRFAPVLLLTGLVLTGCGRTAPEQVQTADAAPVAAEADPLNAIPLDSLYGATAVENLRQVPVELELRGIPRGWDGMRVAVLSDFQLGLWPDNRAVVQAALRGAVAAEPDLIVLLGDFVAIGERGDDLRALLAPLRGRQVLAVLGERDLRSDTLAASVEQALRSQGVTVLRNQVVAFARGVDTAYIAGIDPGFAFTADQQAQLWGELPGGAATPLLLSHLPTALQRLPAERFAAVLAGHTFCGDADVPGTPSLRALLEETLAAERVPRTGRLFRGGGATLFVTCGLGYSFVPMRFGGAPEWALITLLRMPEPAPAADTVPPTSPG